ncbi:MAG: hypothetical protein GKR91_02145 [Pseudomonadales bacterium]|nr:hypothetical protein [Pseudomonadales bacterium]
MKKLLLQFSILVATLTTSSAVFSQERWFKIELSIFTNENSTDRIEEEWQAERMELTYPGQLRRLNKLSDLLLADNLQLSALDNFASTTDEDLLAPEEIQAQIRAESIAAVGPLPATQNSGFKIFDFQREDFLQLPTAESDFQQTNRTLERSADHRLLFHGLWRQAVLQPDDSIPIYIEGGLAYGDQHELQGSLTIRFNDNEDRVVIDTNLWLTEFSFVENTNNDWQLPIIPTAVRSDPTLSSDLRYYPIQIYQMEQSREMRSTEFHYLDHPALGIVILVEPFEIPEAPLPTPGF